VPYEIFSDRNAQDYGPSCPQQKVNFLPVPFNGSADISAPAKELPLFNNVPDEESEDCMYLFSYILVSTRVLTSALGLTINVIRPSDTDQQDRYPVVVVRVLAALIC
jgi:hypothetical protein